MTTMRADLPEVPAYATAAPPRRLTRPGAFAALAVLVAAAAAFRWLHAQFAFDVDEAYVTYRYARNLVEGIGFVYNPGERVLGTASPLYTLLLAGLAWLGFDMPSAAAWCNVACAASGVALLFAWLARRLDSVWVGLVGVLVLLSFPEFVQCAVSGTEASLCVLLSLLTFALYDGGRRKTAAITAGLCVLARLDGAAVPAALCLCRLLTHRRWPSFAACALFALTVLPWFGFALWYFGDVRPQSTIAAHEHAATNRWWIQTFFGAPSAAVLWPLALLGALRAASPAGSWPGVAALGTWAAVHAAALTWRGIDPRPFDLLPVVIALAALAVVGVGAACRALTQHAPTGRRRDLLDAAVVVAALAPFLIARGPALLRHVQQQIDRRETSGRARAELADHLAAHAAPDDVVAVETIGIVGWRTRARILDLSGAVTRDAVGRTVEANLRRSRARWYVGENASRDEPLATVSGYPLVGVFRRHPDRALLLYDARGEAGAFATTTTAGGRFEAGNGLAIEFGALTARGLELRLSASAAVAKAYKVFVHVLGREGDEPLEFADFAPPTPTSAMEPGRVYEVVVPLPRPLAVGERVRVGYFDEQDPSFARLRDAAGGTFVEVVRSAAAAAASPPLGSPR